MYTKMSPIWNFLPRSIPLASPSAAASRLFRDLDNDRAARVQECRVWRINDVDMLIFLSCD